MDPGGRARKCFALHIRVDNCRLRDQVEPAGVGQVEVFSYTIGFGPCATAEHVRAGEETPEGTIVDGMTILLILKGGWR